MTGMTSTYVKFPEIAIESDTIALESICCSSGYYDSYSDEEYRKHGVTHVHHFWKPDEYMLMDGTMLCLEEAEKWMEKHGATRYEDEIAALCA